MSLTSKNSSLKDLDEDENRMTFGRASAQKLLGMVRAHPGLLLGGLISLLVSTVSLLLIPRIFGWAVDQALVPRDAERIVFWVGVLAAVEAIRVLATIAMTYLFAVIGQKVMLDLRMRLITHIVSLPIKSFDLIPAGKLVTRITNDISSLGELFSAGFVTVLSNILTILGIIVGLLILDWRLGLITVSVVPFVAIACVFFSRRLAWAYRESRRWLSSLNAFLAENILGMREVHLFGCDDKHEKEFREINDQYATAQFGTVRVFALFRPTITFFAGLSMALVIAFGGGWVLDGSIPLGIVVAFFGYVIAFFEPVGELTDKWNMFLSGMTSADRIFSLLDWREEEGLDYAKPLPFSPLEIKGRIEFRDVWFGYQEGVNQEVQWVLRGVSFIVEPGRKLGIVGPTGSGKSTLLQLLLRFYEPQKGEILIDGRNIREYDKRQLRAAIGIIQQDVFLFSGNIEENITLWHEERRSRALEGVHRLVAGDGFNRDLQERGKNLSMGEKQVLAFSRAYAADPRIWILDEASSNVDTETEEKLNHWLETAAKGRSLLVVAHRLATIRNADLILVMNRGVVAELGNHQELMRSKGLYCRLYRYQESSEGSAVYQ